MSKLEKFNSLLFDPGEVVCCGELWENDIKPFDAGTGSMFYTINPLDPRIDHAHKEKDSYDYLTPRRADMNVHKFRNFMFEMDNESLNDQRLILHGCGIPWTAIVYSGGKSLHAILSLGTTLGGEHTKDGVAQYKTIWKRLALKIEEFANSVGFSNVIDPSSKNASRFTRYPETVRDNGVRQSIILLDARVSYEDFNTLLSSCPKVFVSVVKALNKLDIENVEEFFSSAPQALIDEVKFPIGLQPAGQYPKLLRLSLWAKDLGISKEVWINVLNYKYFPKLLEAGYPEHKLEVGIDHAYRR